MGALAVVKQEDWLRLVRVVRVVLCIVANGVCILFEICVKEWGAPIPIVGWVVKSSHKTGSVVNVTHVSEMALDFACFTHCFLQADWR